MPFLTNDKLFNHAEKGGKQNTMKLFLYMNYIKDNLNSIGIVTDNGKSFYAENKNGIKSIAFSEWYTKDCFFNIKDSIRMKDDYVNIMKNLSQWINKIRDNKKIEIWIDNSYLNMDLYSSLIDETELENINEIPCDINTLLQISGMEYDVLSDIVDSDMMEQFDGIFKDKKENTSLYNAYLIKNAYDKCIISKKIKMLNKMLKYIYNIDIFDFKDKMKGGISDRITLEQIAQIPIKELLDGIKTEMKEHSDDPYLALEISLDHQMENPPKTFEYYPRLKQMEAEMEAK